MESASALSALCSLSSLLRVVLHAAVLDVVGCGLVSSESILDGSLLKNSPMMDLAVLVDIHLVLSR
eukprot:12928098-Prorocentrum_lima.AAC.1